MKQRVLLVGGGLANGLIALRLAERKDVECTLVEREERIGGEHVWSFHDSDLDAAQLEWIGPLIERSWPTHGVRFPRFCRTLSGGYHAVTSDRLRQRVAQSDGIRIRSGVAARSLEPHGVALEDGTRIEADAVLDGRGAVPASPELRIAAQKFVGQWLELDSPHDLAGPLLMDATVGQPDGYRFVYTLPFSPTLVHVEDTLYDADAMIDLPAMRESIQRYAGEQGWSVRRVVREERGVLPIVLGGDIEAFWASGPAGVPRSGMRAALFHPTTGYSLPDAVRLADELARRDTLGSEDLHAWIRARSIDKWKRDRFYRLLNRMLFEAALPGRRHLVLQRFYRLPEPLIQRFYAGRSTVADRFRVLVGRPPVPVRRALSCLVDSRRPTPRVS
ncbi:MAG: lycopene beta-cyclase CrtY [Acidobacteria bacterium]|nr:lycopene beta-cyclase CrtY [Acidobacteriota bacterium]NIM63896.1 lycopene beta-cyclase CrtY [Acidobacteriota bacterium]NIO60165.1 lycopene beta-cyclase CrtY [Acidobacteriota bacterium]NIQ31229.1 lycopene beta-cyclase CrtY [Acidobacteriota bacterium]NIQ86366.1 lycopene beta-cyclase CrtY [Acidobacteriota bacterium]